MNPSLSLKEFYSGLLNAGVARVTREPVPTLSEAETAELAALMEQGFRDSLLDLPGERHHDLGWHPASARSALEFLYRLAQALVDRTMPPAQVTALVAAPPPIPVSPGEMLSMDVTLRHLPELYATARALGPEDPLVTGCESTASLFPLSSVGIPLSNLADIQLLRTHPIIWQLYVDRVIERQDDRRLEDPACRRAVADALGEHGYSLAPKLAARLALGQPSAGPTSES